MKTCGIEIDNDKVIIVAIEEYGDGIVELNEHSAKLQLENHEDSENIKQFSDLIHSQLDTIDADLTCIIKRQMKGPYAAGGLSFKIESLIQCYRPKDIKLVALQTIKAYFKKHSQDLKPKYKYQENALLAANFMLKK
jgi:hypothetical protein